MSSDFETSPFALCLNDGGQTLSIILFMKSLGCWSPIRERRGLKWFGTRGTCCTTSHVTFLPFFQRVLLQYPDTSNCVENRWGRLSASTYANRKPTTIYYTLRITTQLTSREQGDSVTNCLHPITTFFILSLSISSTRPIHDRVLIPPGHGRSRLNEWRHA